MNENKPSEVKRYYPKDISFLWMTNASELQYLNTGKVDKFVREEDYESLRSEIQSLKSQLAESIPKKALIDYRNGYRRYTRYFDNDFWEFIESYKPNTGEQNG